MNALLFLRHATSTAIRPLDAASAVEQLLKVASVLWYDGALVNDALSFCEHLLSSVAVYELRFRPAGHELRDALCELSVAA